MLPTRIARAAVQARTPLIKFLGPRAALHEVESRTSGNNLMDKKQLFNHSTENKRVKATHHDPTRHPAAPKDAEYPLKAATPVKNTASTSKSTSNAITTPGPHGASRSFFEFGELPTRYRPSMLTEAEIEAVEAGGATAIY
ncbi:hypothetical protein FBU30_005347 [Linnemannia zychae]|nr:hypothetical protein FBU30_005347 [Linnemannia zychae]